ncbi:hypothetical protein AB0I28_09690 [Phytomonospora sp. NPDC050363]|uniref:hypothetical protein n=1 Tax=Phytomonospora sp. NPDC050363 TaxID=3155642 RepID=UPI0033CC3479
MSTETLPDTTPQATAAEMPAMGADKGTELPQVPVEVPGVGAARTVVVWGGAGAVLVMATVAQLAGRWPLAAAGVAVSLLLGLWAWRRRAAARKAAAAAGGKLGGKLGAHRSGGLGKGSRARRRAARKAAAAAKRDRKAAATGGHAGGKSGRSKRADGRAANKAGRKRSGASKSRGGLSGGGRAGGGRSGRLNGSSARRGAVGGRAGRRVSGATGRARRAVQKRSRGIRIWASSRGAWWATWRITSVTGALLWLAAIGAWRLGQLLVPAVGWALGALALLGARMAGAIWRGIRRRLHTHTTRRLSHPTPRVARTAWRSLIYVAIAERTTPARPPVPAHGGTRPAPASRPMSPIPLNIELLLRGARPVTPAPTRRFFDMHPALVSLVEAASDLGAWQPDTASDGSYLVMDLHRFFQAVPTAMEALAAAFVQVANNLDGTTYFTGYENAGGMAQLLNVVKDGADDAAHRFYLSEQTEIDRLTNARTDEAGRDAIANADHS